MSTLLGKAAEGKIREWLDHPENGHSLDRIPDQMTGFYGSKNICDFVYYRYPNQYYIESKATEADRWDLSQLTDTQFNGLLSKSHIKGCFGVVIVLWASYQETYVFDIRDLAQLVRSGQKSLNIKKRLEWPIPYVKIPCVANTRKHLLDYEDVPLSYLVAQLQLQACRPHEPL